MLGVGRIAKNLVTNGDVSNSFIYSKGLADYGKSISQHYKSGKEASRKLQYLGEDSMKRVEAITNRSNELETKAANLAGKTDEASLKAIRQTRQEINDLGRIAGMSDAEVAAERARVIAQRDAADRAIWNQVKQAPKQGWGYLTAADRAGSNDRFKVGAMRTGLAVGAYAGANAGLRYMSGGGITYNNRGERDIAGIPFI